MKVNRFKDIVFEYELAPQNSQKMLVLLGGLPGFPKQYDLLNKIFIDKGFNIIYPRYEGTWESAGSFLNRPPIDAMGELFQYLHSEALLDEVKGTANEIYVLSSSFGGYVAMELSNLHYVKKICALSPVVSFKQVMRIVTLEAFISQYYPGAYRFESKDWQKMINDELKSPCSANFFTPDKLLVLAGAKDPQIIASDLESFSKDKNIKNFHIMDLPHVTFSKINSELQNMIFDFFDDDSKG